MFQCEALGVLAALAAALQFHNMPVLWLAAYSAAAPHRFRIGTKRTRKESLLSTTHLVADELQRDPDAHPRSRRILALLNVSEGFVYEGICTPWPAEAWRAYAALQCPCDAFTLHVQSCFQLHLPLEVAHILDQGGHIVSNPRLQQSIFLPQLPTGWQDCLGTLHGQMQAQRLGDVLAHWVMPGLLDDEKVFPALALTAIDAEAVLQGHTSCLFCLGRWVRDISKRFQETIGFPQMRWLLDRGKAAAHDAWMTHLCLRLCWLSSWNMSVSCCTVMLYKALKRPSSNKSKMGTSASTHPFTEAIF